MTIWSVTIKHKRKLLKQCKGFLFHGRSTDKGPQCRGGLWAGEDQSPTALGLSASCQEACSSSPTKPGQKRPAGTGTILEDKQADGAYTEGRDTRHTLSCVLAFSPAITGTKANTKGNSKSKEDGAKHQPARPLHPLNYPPTHTYAQCR